MKKNTCLILITTLLCIHTTIYSQNFTSSFDWEASPAFTKADSTEHDGYIYKLADRSINEITLDEQGQAHFYYTKHFRAKILTEGGIEVYNKVELPLRDIKEIVKLKARTISPDGTVTNLTTNAIKHIDNYNGTGVDYKVFVFEGLSIGAEIEYIYTFIKDPVVYGYTYLQWNVDALREEFDLIYPSYLDFRVKTYQEGVITTTDTLEYGSRKYVHKLFSNQNVKAIKSEPYSNWKTHLARIEYVLDKNRETGNYEMNTYKILAQNYYGNLYPEDPKPNKKAIALVKKIVTDPTDKILTAKEIENYVKANFNVTEEDYDKNTTKIFAGFSGSESDRCTALIEMYRAAGFKVELVFTTDNSYRKFDPDFQSPSNCKQFLIYLPEIAYFLSPENIILKSGYYETSTFEQNGMFIKQVCVGDFCNGISYIGYIPSKKSSESVHDMNLNVSFKNDMSQADIKFNNSMSGYHASSIQPIYGFLETENQDELKKNLVQNFAGEYVTADITVENGTYQSAFDKPFIIRGTVTTESLMENAGNKYIFKLGYILGEQSELYDKEKRQLPVENDFNRIYSRTITITIPAGYKISNLSDFKDGKISCDYNGKDAAGIQFSYLLAENTFTITINEYYNILLLPLEEYSEYRDVINAAADFNKKTIIFSKEQ